MVCIGHVTMSVLVGMDVPAITKGLGSFTARRMHALRGGVVWALGCWGVGEAGWGLVGLEDGMESAHGGMPRWAASGDLFR